MKTIIFVTKIIFLSLFMLILLNYLANDVPFIQAGFGIEKQVTYGTNTDDVPLDLTLDNLGNIIIVGKTRYGGGDWNAFIIKLDPNGNLLWSKRWGTPDYDEANSVTVDNSNNIYVAGYYTALGRFFGYILKFDPNGNLLGQREIRGSSNQPAKIFDIKFESARNLISVTGSVNDLYRENVMITLLSTSLTLAEHVENFAFRRSSLFRDDISLGIDNFGRVGTTYYYFITGKTVLSGNEDFFIARISDGSSLDRARMWDNTANDAGEDILIVNENVCARNKCIYVVGYVTVGSDTDAFIAKYNFDLNIIWRKRFGGGNFDKAYAIAEDPTDGNLVVVGETYSFGTSGAVFIAKFNRSGFLLWSRIYDGNNIDKGFSLFVDSFGDIHITGSTRTYPNSLTSVTMITSNINFPQRDPLPAHRPHGDLSTPGFLLSPYPLTTNSPQNDEVFYARLGEITTITTTTTVFTTTTTTITTTTTSTSTITTTTTTTTTTSGTTTTTATSYTTTMTTATTTTTVTSYAACPTLVLNPEEIQLVIQNKENERRIYSIITLIFSLSTLITSILYFKEKINVKRKRQYMLMTGIFVIFSFIALGLMLNTFVEISQLKLTC